MPRTSKRPAFSQAGGSPEKGEPLFLAVGRLLKPHGLHGEMSMDVLTDFPERIKPGQTLYLGEQHTELEISGVHGHSSSFLIQFNKYDTPEAAAVLRNQLVFVRASDRPSLPEGEYYHHQLLGLKAITDEGEVLGEVSGILETGANDVFSVRSESGKEVLIPNISSIVTEINLEAGLIRVHLAPGLLPD